MTVLSIEWKQRANCRGKGQAFYCSERGVSYPSEIFALCDACPVRPQCLDWVLSWEKTGERFGVWAGLNPEKRQEEYRRRIRAQRPGSAPIRVPVPVAV